MMLHEVEIFCELVAVDDGWANKMGVVRFFEWWEVLSLSGEHSWMAKLTRNASKGDLSDEPGQHNHLQMIMLHLYPSHSEIWRFSVRFEAEPNGDS